MSYDERIPLAAPECSDEEAQRLRDLWRPSIQEQFQPLRRTILGDDGLETLYRDKGYDASRASLTTGVRMYVIPPIVAEPLMRELDEHHDATFFEIDDWQIGVEFSAEEFMRRLMPNNALQPIKKHSCQTRATAELEYRARRSPGGGTYMEHPHIGVDAPILERKIPKPGSELSDSIHRNEGSLGWTVPRWKKEPPHAGASLLVADNMLAAAWWYGMPAERLSLTFKYPQLNKLGQSALSAALVELEELVPAGTNYDDLYLYHPRTRQEGSFSDKWVGTDEDNEQEAARQRAADARNRQPSWLDRQDALWYVR